MEALPSSIEAYLKESHFSGTEIAIIQALLSEDALTLRELSAKTSKSTGVLDQASKKLLARGIASKIVINRNPKIAVTLQSISDWIENDLRQKDAALAVRQENFRLFLDGFASKKGQPDMKYYEGVEGIMQLYDDLLDGADQTRHYMPALYAVKDDPLGDFRKKHAKERKKRGIFSRVISEDIENGRDAQSHDAEYFRETLLVPSERYLFFIEEAIAGDRMAYIDHENKSACCLKFSMLAQYHGFFFEGDWKAAKSVATTSASSPIRS